MFTATGVTTMTSTWEVPMNLQKRKYNKYDTFLALVYAANLSSVNNIKIKF